VFKENLKVFKNKLLLGLDEAKSPHPKEPFSLGSGFTVYIVKEYPLKEEDKVNFKIGYSGGEDRPREMQTGNCRKLETILRSSTMSEGNAKSLESYLHKLFSKTKIRSEWFNLTTDDLDQIRSIFEMEYVLVKIILKNSNHDEPYVIDMPLDL